MWHFYLSRDQKEDGVFEKIVIPSNGEECLLGRKNFFARNDSSDVRVSRAHVTAKARVGVVPLLEMSGKGMVRGKKFEGKEILQVGDKYSLLNDGSHSYTFCAEKLENNESKGKEKDEIEIVEIFGERESKKIRIEKDSSKVINLLDDEAFMFDNIPQKPIGKKEMPSSMTWYVNSMPHRNNEGCLDLRLLLNDPSINEVIMSSYELESNWLYTFFPVLQKVPVWVSCRAR